VTTFFQLVVVGLSTGSAFALVGIGIVLVYRTTGIINFAQGVFAVIGALYTFRFAESLPTAAAMVIAIAIAAVASSFLAVVAVGLRGRTTSLASMIITLGASFVAEALLLLEFGDIPRTYNGISQHAWNIGGVLVQPQYVLIAGVALVATIGLTLFLRRTILGQALVACSDSRRASELVGLNTRSLSVVAFVAAGALCALGGALVAPSSPMTYSSDVAITINGFAAAVFGGLASVRLALIGGYALGILEQFVVGYVDPQYSLIIALVVMLALIGWRSRREVAGLVHHAQPAVHRPRVPWPAPLRLALIAVATALGCWFAYRLGPANVTLYDRMALYALAAVGLTLLMGFAGQVSLGQGAFFLIGAYTSAILTVGVDPAHRLADPDAGVAPLLALLAAPVVTAALAAVIGLPLLRLRGHYLAFATLSLHLIAYSLLYAWDRFSGGQYGITVTRPLEVAGHTIRGADHAAVAWGLVGVSLVLATNLVHSRVGRALQAIATDEPSAAASGIAVATYKLRLFVLAAALAGLGGGLFTFSFQFVSPEAFPIVLSVEFVVMAAVGGLGNVYGAVAGTIAILYLEQKLRELGAKPELLGWTLPPAAPTVFSYGVFGLILIVIMLWFPRGLLPALGDTMEPLRAKAAARRRKRTVAPGRREPADEA
jgi:branched-chain amino acid transport system permease protein